MVVVKQQVNLCCGKEPPSCEEHGVACVAFFLVVELDRLSVFACVYFFVSWLVIYYGLFYFSWFVRC